MKTLKKIDLDKFFYALKDEDYAIIKIFDVFPRYYPGSDIDLYCQNMKNVANKILTEANEYIKDGFRIIVTSKDDGGTYIDFFEGEDRNIHFRFDLHQSLPNFKRLDIHKAYFFSVLENKESNVRKYDSKSYNIYVPSKIDDIFLRYVEYIEWYEQRPDKIKHLEYILKKLKTEPEQIRFLDKLHIYTKPKLMDVPLNTHFGRNVLFESNQNIIRMKNEVAELKKEIENTYEKFDEINKNIIELKKLSFFYIVKSKIGTFRKKINRFKDN